ncbi:pyrroloquinoline quinone precursor peptide PqqA [Streptomyces sp. AF1B]|jgi:coenzyme PQQ precursor peptide PqqA|uniref:pyrroloquinoline quinone precursor peptide PqqA n=1 Tax=Streptomyces sp. AF1B TaxID=3399503 RepID=UPI003AAE3452
MNQTTEQPKPVESAPRTNPRTAPKYETGRATWQTPSYQVVDTALEVTGYSLNSR